MTLSETGSLDRLFVSRIEHTPWEVFQARVIPLSDLLSSLRHMTEATVEPEDSREVEREKLTRLVPSVWQEMREQILSIVEISQELEEYELEEAKRFASLAIQPHFMGCGLHHRIVMKPQGHDGDYKLMTYFFSDEWLGITRFDRLMHAVARRYALSEAIIGRERVFRAQIHQAIASSAAPRIASIASGPAIEMERVIRESEERHKPITLYLFDQDPEANAYAEAKLHQAIADTGKSNIEVVATTESIRALLKPRNPGHQAILDDVLTGLDYVYSSGLFDYLDDRAGTALASVLVDRVAPGGRVSIGNLQRRDDTSWLLDFVLEWPLIYRCEEDMVAMAARMERGDVEVEVGTDESGGCLVLELHRRAD